MLGPFHAAAESGAFWTHESFAARGLLPAFRGRLPGYTVPCETRWTGDRSLFTGVIHSAYEGDDADLCVAGWGQPVTVSGTLPFLIQDVDGAELFGLFMFLRIARALAQYVTDSSFVEQGVNKRGRSASTSAWADLWRDVWCEIDAWGGLGDKLSVRKVKAHTTLEALLAGIITADDWAGNDGRCSLQAGGFGTPRPAEHPRSEAHSHVGRHVHGALDCARRLCETANGH